MSKLILQNIADGIDFGDFFFEERKAKRKRKFDFKDLDYKPVKPLIWW